MSSITLPGQGKKIETEEQAGSVHRQVFEIGSVGDDAEFPIVNAGLAVASANFTRPADTTAYTSGDLVANNTVAASVTPLSFTVSRASDVAVKITKAHLKKSGTSTTNAQFRLHLYRNDPSASTGIANGDNAAFSTKEAGYLGSIDITIGLAFTDGAKGSAVPNVGTSIIALPKSGSQLIYGLLEARAAYTPASAEVFTAELEIDGR